MKRFQKVLMNVGLGLFGSFCTHISVSVQHIVSLASCSSWPASASVASCGGGKVKGWWVSWNRQEATSVVWRLTRMDCMTDAHEAHLGCPGQAGLAVRSAGVRSALQPPPSRLQEVGPLQTQTGHLEGWLLISCTPQSCWSATCLVLCQTRRHFPFCSLLSLCNPAPPQYLWWRIFPLVWMDQETHRQWAKMDHTICRFMAAVCVLQCMYGTVSVPADEQTRLQSQLPESTVAAFVETVWAQMHCIYLVSAQQFVPNDSFSHDQQCSRKKKKQNCIANVILVHTVSEFHNLIEGLVCLSVSPQNNMQPLKASCLQSGVLYVDLDELVKGQPGGWLSQITPVWRRKGEPAALRWGFT